jgi:tetratricopeptide (TPR) repeat protein
VQAIEEAVAFSIGGREAQAATLFQSMSARFAGDHRVAIAYADHLMRFERYEMVRGAVAAIPRESPLAADAAWRIALAAAAKLDFAAAHQAFTEAATLSVPAAWSGVAASMPRLAAAAATVDREPRNVDAKIAYGQALAEFGAMDQAYGQLNQSRFLDTTRVEADYWIAFYLMRDGRALHATRALERALARDPGHRPSRILMAEALASGDDWRKAIPHFERALEQDPSDARSQYNLACLKARAGEVEAAIAALERALAAGYDDWAQIETDPDLEPVRTHPGFARLRERRPGSR